MPRENATVATLRSPIGKSSAAHRSAAGLMNAVTKLVSITDTQDDPDRPASSVCPRVPLVCRVVQVDAEGKPISTPSKPRSCALQKPLLGAALLDAFALPATKRLSDGESLEITALVSVGGRDEPIIVSKLVAKRAALWAMDRHGDRIRASGELSAEQLECPRRLNKALARTTSDLSFSTSSLTVPTRCAQKKTGPHCFNCTPLFRGWSVPGRAVVGSCTARRARRCSSAHGPMPSPLRSYPRRDVCLCVAARWRGEVARRGGAARWRGEVARMV